MLKTTRLSMVSISQIDLTLGTQTRSLAGIKAQETYRRVLNSYRDLMIDGNWDWEKSPPDLFGPTFYLGKQIYVPGDGHTRIQAASEAGRNSILSNIHSGSVREAIRFAIGPANRHYFSNRLNNEDLANRLDLALNDRQMWGWSDKRLSQYCDDGRGRLKRKQVASARITMLDFWRERDRGEWEWRLAEMSRLREVRPDGGEFIVRDRYSHQPPVDRQIDVSGLSEFASLLVDRRASAAGMKPVEWIESAILSVDSMLAERDVLLGKLTSLNIEMPTTSTRSQTYYRYIGSTKMLNRIGTEDLVTISSQQIVVAIETEAQLPSDQIAIGFDDPDWPEDNYLLVSLGDLEWIASPLDREL